MPKKKSSASHQPTKGGNKKRHTAAFKAQVALAALRNDASTNELGSRFGLHPTQISHWKKQLLDGAASVFDQGPNTAAVDQERLAADLYEQLGRAHAELEWLKKKVGP